MAGENAVLAGAFAEREAHVRAAVVDGEDFVSFFDEEEGAVFAFYGFKIGIGEVGKGSGVEVGHFKDEG